MLAVTQIWPEEFQQRYRQAGYWRGETFGAWLRQRAQEIPQQTAIISQQRQWSYQQLDQQVDATAQALQQLGFQAGDRIVVQLPNIAEFISCIFAMFRLGVIPIYALPAHRRAEVEHFISTGAAKGYLIADSFAGFDYRQLARSIQADQPQLQQVLVLGEAEEFIDLNHTVSAADGNNYQAAAIDPQSVAFIQISGGSTGLSKLIPRTHDDYIYSIRESAAITGLTSASRFMVTLPIAHNFPMSSPGFMGALYAGATVILSTSTSPEITFPLIAQHQITDVSLVPPLLSLWLQAAENTSIDLSSLKTVQVGGAKLVAEVAKRVKPVLNATLQQVFGMAEGLVNYTRLDDSQELIINSQGRPISPDDEILILDDYGNPVAAGEPGHLLVRGPYTIRAYYNNPGANERSFTADGFYRTGDIVKLSPEGYLMVQGRAGDHINRAGEKISAEEIENHLLAHPNVFEAAVVSVPDEYLGERSCAFIIVQGEQPKKAALKNWIRQRGLAEFKIPDQIIFLDSFDTTAAGKISRKELRRQLKHLHLDQPE